MTFRTFALLAAAAALGGCAAPPQTVNYGHPALNAAVAPMPAAATNDPGRVALGTLAGGLIGAQVGQGNGRVAAAALGAGLGAWLAAPPQR